MAAVIKGGGGGHTNTHSHLTEYHDILNIAQTNKNSGRAQHEPAEQGMFQSLIFFCQIKNPPQGERRCQNPPVTLRDFPLALPLMSQLHPDWLRPS